MFKNYIKIALRNLVRQKTYSFISISGLSIGLACCLIVLAYVINELSYDNFHKDADKIYRVVRKMPDIHGPSTRNPMAPALMENFPEIDLAVRTWKLREPYTFFIGDKRFRQSGILFADSEIFKLFTYEFLRGNAKNPLEDPQSVVLTKSASQKYFGNEDPIGKTLSFDGEFDLLVTAVIEDVPHNSHLQFELVLPIERFNKISAYIYGYDATQFRITDEWRAGMFNTYLKLHKDIDPQTLEQKFPGFLKKYAPYNKELLDETLYLQPVKDIHLFSQYRSARDKSSDIKFVYVIIAIGSVILLMSCFNYINLTTARFSARVREIGIRKVVGAQRKQLARQFLAESGIFSLIAFIFSFVLMELFEPAIVNMLGYKISADYLGGHSFILFALLIAILTFFVSGSYPAIFFSRISAGNVLKDMITPRTQGKGVRSAFVFLQFSITIALLAGTGFIYKQVRFMKSKNLGYTKNQIVVVPIKDDEIRERSKTVKFELSQIPGVSMVSFSTNLPNRIPLSTTMDMEINGKRTVFEMNNTSIDEDFLDLYEIDLLRGRNFSEDHPSDPENGIILNEQAVKILNWEEPVGEDLRIFGGDRKVIGVVKDFNFQSLHAMVSPLALSLASNPYKFASIKIDTKNIPATLDKIEKTFRKFVPARAFESFFFDDYFENLYRAEENFGKTIGYMTMLAIVISALGLFGLSLFIMERRTKEIGIRKVLGASVPRIVAMLSREFTRWALLANIIAWPVAWYSTNKWLQNFAYRIEISWWIFALSGGLALMIALITVSIQAIRAALAKPVKALRYE